MKLLRTLIIVICLGIMAFGGYKIYSIQSGYRQGEQTYQALEQFIQPAAPSSKPAPAKKEEKPKPQPASSAEETVGQTIPEQEEEAPVRFPTVDFDSLRRINSGVVGWIYCEDTSINYPVVQGKDNDYYLDHMFDGQPNGSGAIFLNSRNLADFSDAHTIIFGHNMKNGSMFAGLSQFRDQSYFEEHPRFLLMTPEGNYTMDVFAGVVMGEWDKVWKTSFADDAEMEDWLDEMIRKSEIDSDIVPTAADRILTLSTCTYEYDGARFLVMGVLREAKENAG